MRYPALRRVAVIDIDVHHGNGTQGIFYERSDVYFVSLHRDQPGCYEASLLYLKAGSMARRVDQSTVKRVPQPTLVVWGSEDDILPLSDAYAFQRDLPDCVGVREVEGSGHSPHLDNPSPVVAHLREFIFRTDLPEFDTP